MDIGEREAAGHLTVLARARARAEAAEWVAMLRFRQTECVRVRELDGVVRQRVERDGVVWSIGQALGLSESQVMNRFAAADRVIADAPLTWAAFRAGMVDGARVREIGLTLDKLVRTESKARLDAKVVAYASGHTVAELRAWLRRFVRRVEGDLAVERADEERKHRCVEVRHTDDGMAWLTAYLPSHVAAAIDKRLSKEAIGFGADDPRTKAQRRADLFAAWLTTNEAGQAAMGADVAVTITADILAGAREGFAEAADGSWGVPAAWITELALNLAEHGGAFWHRMVLHPVTGDVLAHEYDGRYAPEILAKALRFRDGVCQAPGCLTPADRCDLDHRRPWPEGNTSGENMWALCRRHHSMKGHRVLRWVLPHEPDPPPVTRYLNSEIYLPITTHLEYVPAA
ncbi:HNH endonuclease domain protein [Aeromicrobium marinum DSM 15272]|uniref:HNH endonuclease domain protein n=1 Tax=Aeromicrobium marinum DSM 15272 TaxID=585531 RepID=E2SCG2_9ACTN|nr:HNH endonuclease signature motif containing protein [Aeromicrobium marinum]EFQ82915.1 HNH endonuclease domain protein [Aeromicrobium marinum DSM 15272]